MNIRKIFLGLLLTISLIFSANFVYVEASAANTLVIHYYRYDNNYSDWDLWLWPSGGSGTDYSFNGTDSYGVSATIGLSETPLDGSDSIGIVIKNSIWAKDYEADRFISILHPNGNGEVHAYFLQGEGYFSYVETDQAGCDHSNPDPNLCAQEFATGLLDIFFDNSYKVFWIYCI